MSLYNNTRSTGIPRFQQILMLETFNVYNCNIIRFYKILYPGVSLKIAIKKLIQ